MKSRTLIAVLVLSCAAAAFGAEGLAWWAAPWNESFRSASTSSLLEDDLDLMLDPARLPEISGIRLYTGLSNLVDKQDHVFSNTGNGHYLIGGSGKLYREDFGYGGLLYDRRITRFNDTVRLDVSQFVDVDGNGTYDRKTVMQQVTSPGSQDRSTHWWLGYGRKLGPGTLGALFYHVLVFQKIQPDLYNGVNANFTQSIEVTDLANAGATIGQIDIEGVLHQKISQRVNGGALTYWLPLTAKLDVGLAAGFSKLDAGQIDSSQYSLESTNPSAPGSNGTTIDSTAVLDVIAPYLYGTEIDIRAAGVWKWSDQVKTRADVSFMTCTGKRAEDKGMANFSYHRLDAFQLVSGTVSRDTSREGTGKIAQDNHLTGVGFLAKTTAQLGEKVVLAVGLGLSTSKRDNSMTRTDSYNETVVYNDGDPALMSDYTTVLEGAQKTKQMHTEAASSIWTPVGLELIVAKPVCLRLGAWHSFDYLNMTDNTVIETTPGTTTTTDAYGRRTVTHPSPVTTVNGLSVSRKIAETHHGYTYGAGWDVSEHLQIDLMGFSKLDDLSNWQLSAIVKF